jgi:hypothetical protein
MPGRDPAAGQIVADAPLNTGFADGAHATDREPVTSTSESAAWWRSALRSPVVIALGASVLLALLSAAILPTVASYDPWSWIDWGRDVVDPHLSFVTGGGPSWKPLPVMFTTVFALFGGAGPTLWVIAARAGGLFGLFGAWRLASKLTAALDSRVATAIAGVVAILGIILTQDYVYYWFRGTSEPMLVGCAIWAVDRMLEGKRAQAFLFGVLLGLMRPEVWVLLGVYGVWLWFKEPKLRWLVVAGFLAQPVFWFVPTWIGSGQPFLAWSHAQDYNGNLGSHPVLEAIRRSWNLQILPVVIAAMVAVILGWFKGPRRLTLLLAGGAILWIAVVCGLVVDGSPGLERFFLPASAIICVLAGSGVARVAVLATDWLSSAVRGLGSVRLRQLITAGVAVVVVVISIPLASSRIDGARAQEGLANLAVKSINQLGDAVKAVGGHDGVFPCQTSASAVNHSLQTALAWKLHVVLPRVGTALRAPGVLFVGPHNTVDGGAAATDPRLTDSKLLATVGVWKVYRYTDPNVPTNCAGR